MRKTAKFRTLAALSLTIAGLSCATTAYAASTSPKSSAYVVQQGDTLFKIAKRFHLTLTAMEHANASVKNFNHIVPGETLNLPAASPVAHLPAPAAASTVHGVISTASKLMGIHYVWGGTSVKGFDCYGFVQYVFAKNGVSLPRTAHQQATVGHPVTKSALRPGDLVFFANTDSYGRLYANHVTHVGIYLGNGNMIESTSVNLRGVAVIHGIWNNSYYRSHYYGARRVIH